MEAKDECPFVRHRLFKIYGGRGDYDFKMLPSSSYGYFVANRQMAMRLTRHGNQLESVLSAEWNNLIATDPVLLASFILNLFRSEDYKSHSLFRDSSDFEKLKHLDEQELTIAFPWIGVTQANRIGTSIKVRAISLFGGMFTGKELGFETFTISMNGHVQFKPRCVLSSKPFLEVRELPPVWG